MKHTGDSSTNLMRTEAEKSTEKDRASELALVSSPVTEVAEHMGCGFGRCRPRFLQVFARPFFFMIILNIYCLVEGAIVSGLTSVVLSSLETRYKFASVQVGMIASTFDITVLVTVLFISYFGGNSHKPRWLGAGVLIQGLGSLLFASPQFIAGDYDIGKHANLSFEACGDVNDFSPDCDEKSSNIYPVFILANILIGIGAAPLFTVGTSYIDDIIHPKHSPIWLGIFYTVAIVGPAVGFGLGGAFLTVYVDPWKDTTLEESDPGWVGAWWLGYILCGVISILISILFFMFPEKYPNSDAIQRERVKLASIQRHKPIKKEDLNIRFQIKELPKHLADLLARVPFLCVTIAFSLQSLIVSGLVSFAPKYLETQFGVTASVGGLLSGAVAIPSAGTGIMLGALLVFFKRPTTKRLSLYFFIINFVATVFLFAFFLRCPTHDIAGITVPYPNSTLFDEQTLSATCNSDCRCLSTVFEPVCSDGITYFSPCRAGCDKYFLNDDSDSPQFENCTCGSSPVAEEGYCDNNCRMLAAFLIVIALALIANMSSQIPYLVVTLRCVADEQRSLALGLQSVFFRAIGTIPGPLIFGALFDASCVYWQRECGDRGNCWVYDNENLSLRMFGISIGIRVLSVVFAFGTWLFYDVTLCNRNHGHVADETEMKKIDST